MRCGVWVGFGALGFGESGEERVAGFCSAPRDYAHLFPVSCELSVIPRPDTRTEMRAVFESKKVAPDSEELPNI